MHHGGLWHCHDVWRRDRGRDVFGRRHCAGHPHLVRCAGGRAAQLHKFDLVKPEKAIADNTLEALQAGVMYGFSGLADKLISKMIQELGLRASLRRADSPT